MYSSTVTCYLVSPNAALGNLLGKLTLASAGSHAATRLPTPGRYDAAEREEFEGIVRSTIKGVRNSNGENLMDLGEFRRGYYEY